MNLDIKSIAIVFPIISSIGWGLIYAINGRNYETITVPTGLIAQGVGMILAGLCVSAALKSPVDFLPYFNHTQKFWFWLAPLLTIMASGFLHLSLRYTNATYTGLVDIIYVLLIPIFAYLLFGQKQWSPHILVGGAVMIVGLVIIVLGQAQKTPL